MSNYQTGYRAMCEAIPDGKAFETLKRISLFKPTPASSDIFGGAVSCTVSVLQNIKKSGLPLLTFKDAAINEFLSQGAYNMCATLTQTLATDPERSGAQIGAIAANIDKYHRAVSFSESAPVPPAPAEPAVQRIEIVNFAEMPAPTVQAFPTRAVQTVERNRDGDIAHTVTTYEP
jgi:hypothetical protein